MTKAELIDQVNVSTAGDRADYLTKGDIEQVVDAALVQIIVGLAAHEEVNIAGFGKFQVKAKPERQGTNPSTGEPMTIAAKNVVSFKPAKAMKDVVN